MSRASHALIFTKMLTSVSDLSGSQPQDINFCKELGDRGSRLQRKKTRDRATQGPQGHRRTSATILPETHR
jgi:hypothetical protein